VQTKSNHKKTGQKPIVRKSLRLARFKERLPIGKTLILKGQTPNGTITFHFKILSPAQQMKERNSAYQFFSID
jgi:hypothetical protein